MVIDQGTHATRALALDATGTIRFSAFCNISLKRIAPDMVEQDAEEIMASTRTVIHALLRDDFVRSAEIISAGLATQRSTAIAWDRRSGRPLSPLISWQDRRQVGWLKQFNRYSKKIKQITGLQLTPHYGASKFRWLLDHLPAVRQAKRNGYLAMGPLAGYLLFHLLKERPFVLDHVNALRTQLLNLDTLEWDPWLQELFGISPDWLPVVRPVCNHFGRLRVADIPLVAVNGDQTSAIYCLGQPHPSTAIINIGTGAFVLLPTGGKRVPEADLLNGLSSSGMGGCEYMTEGTVNGAGAALDWAARRWSLKDPVGHLPTWLKRKGEIPVFINTIGGLGSPWWRQGPAPYLIGEGKPWQNTVAVVESIIFMLKANIERMLAAGFSVRQLQVGGGMTRFDSVCQLLADLTRIVVYCPAEIEATARGIAWLTVGRPARWPKPGRGKFFRPASNPGLDKRYGIFRQILK